ncbi:hypothetical protein ACFTZI_32350 [Streptomyces decoyicus]|uniref:hypothetical protein n=1 Tax=Streptomyces decoyicus TaxID=249567 RepID=UPI003633BEE8
MILENSPSAAGRPRPVIGVSLKLYFGLARTRAWLAEVAALDATLAALPRPMPGAEVPCGQVPGGQVPGGQASGVRIRGG